MTHHAQMILVTKDLPTRERLRRLLPALMAEEFSEVFPQVRVEPVIGDVRARYGIELESEPVWT